MMDTNIGQRKYPIGIQTFSEIIRGGYVYVDKTDLVWQLQDYAKYIFLSRPRRFGKSLLTSTLESFFRDEKYLKNMLNMTLSSKFSAICGITESELATALSADVCQLAVEYECSPDEMHVRLKMQYDGYHFSEKSEEIYNPFSLLTAFQLQKIGNYWFETGTPTYLIRQLQHFHTDITAMDGFEVPSMAFDRPTESMTDAVPLLYQSGYLTIKGYDRESYLYTLSIPNQEVRVGFVDGLLPVYVGLDSKDVQAGFALKFWRALKKGDADLAMRELQSYMAGVPYVEGFKKKLAEVANTEGFYEYTLYLIFSMLNVYVRTQVKCAGGRVDMVVWMPDTVYVFEMKVNDSAKNALQQIDERGYAIQYQTGGRRVVKVGVKFNAKTRVPEEWVVV